MHCVDLSEFEKWILNLEFQLSDDEALSVVLKNAQDNTALCLSKTVRDGGRQSTQLIRFADETFASSASSRKGDMSVP